MAGPRPHLRRRRRGGVLRLAAGVSWIRAPPTLTELGQSADRGRGRGPLLLLHLLLLIEVGDLLRDQERFL